MKRDKMNTEYTIAGKTYSEILFMPRSTRSNWYKRILPEEKAEAMRVVDIAGRAKMSVSLIKYWKDNTEARARMEGKNNPMNRPEVRNKFRGENNPAKRSEVRAKISKAMTGENNPMRKLKGRAKHKAAMNRLEVRANLSAAKRGKNNPSWLDGVSFEPYDAAFDAVLKNQIRERDNHICQECHQAEEQLEYLLSVHHIDYDKKNNSPDNLISLCKSCHSQANFNRNDWTAYFENIVERKNGT